MELKLEVLLSSSIKRKKPWPRFCWLGQEKESVFLLDDKRISEINMVSGRTKKKTPKLHPLLNTVVTMASSPNGLWLCGLLASGELFLWNRDKDLLKTATPVPEVVQMITSSQSKSTMLSLQVSSDGMRVLLSATSGKVFLWECMDSRVLAGMRDGPVKGHWALIQPQAETVLPSPSDKEASQTTIFVKTEVLGDTCLSAFVFTSGENLITTLLKIQWKEGHSVGFVRYSIHWVTKKYPMPRLTPPCQPVKSRGALVPAFSPDGQLLAIALNQRKPQATQILFVSTQNFISISSSLGGCGCKKVDIPSKYIRSYWVGSVSWSPGGLFLACMLKRGSLLMLVRLGGLLSLTSSGCSVDFGPAHFLPLHPLVTYRPPMSAGKGEASLSSSSMSVRDILRQRYSVTWHPRLFYLIVSDGYMATVMRVPDWPSPALMLKILLKDIHKDLEATSCKLDQSKVHVKAWLDSVCYLNLNSSFEELKAALTHRPNTTDSILSAATNGSRLPLFLQNQPGSGGTMELLESMQAFFEEESDLDGIPAGSHDRDRGCLEFASMFDTLHALKTHSSEKNISVQVYDQECEEMENNLLCRELGEIRSRLLTVWAFGLSLGDALEHRSPLLKHLLCCVVQFAALLHLMPNSMRSVESNPLAFTRLLHLIKALLSFLAWDSSPSDGPCCLKLMVEFSKWIVRLLLNPHPDSHLTGSCRISSQSLSRIIFLVQTISDSLDATYTSEQKAVWSSEEESTSQPQVWLSDAYHVPFLQDEKVSQLVKPRPSIRLLGVWQLLYDVIQKYAEELNKVQNCNGLEEEKQKLAVITAQIQTALQETGEKLEEGPALLNCQGEHLFLCGSYHMSAHTWRVQICQEINKSSYRSVFLETRLCLALLYSLLSQYHLREAQEMGDHMAQLILLRSGLQKTHLTADFLPCRWMPTDLHSDAASAVVQTLGRFMASYFTNQPLFILPAHNVAVLPPLHLPHGPNVGRLVLLSQEEVAIAVRQQHLSEVWTVDYAQDLLLLGGLLPEAVWMAYNLGDWKTAVSLSLAYTSFGAEKLKFSRLRRKEFHLPKALTPEGIFQVELECLLKSDSQGHTRKDDEKRFAEPLEVEDWDSLQTSIQEILKASVMAGVNVISSFLSSLLDAAKDMCSSLPALVPAGLYLPSPPLYCPQPSPNTQDPKGTTVQLPEVVYRHKVSGVLQRLLLLLRSACCCHPAAQWYISRLCRARHILHKIKKKYQYAYPSAALEEKSFPEELMKLTAHGGYFKRRAKKDNQLDNDTIHIIDCFREMCALCWMLHVRDQLSIQCRRYQVTRRHDGDEQSDLDSVCVDALHWARRLLPFSRFLNAEEILQDIVLSLVSDLPPLSMVADTLVETFPEEEESVCVPLREKYKSLLQRLRQCTVLDGVEEEENVSMMSLIQGKLRQRRKHLKRLQRHLTPPVLHLWEKEEDMESKSTTPGKPLPGTNQGTGTFSDCGFQSACSDVDTSDKTSDTNLSKQHPRSRSKRAKKKTEQVKADVRIGSQGDSESKKKEQLLQQAVGSWEFELEDEEYLHFLELFLSYVLEKGSSHGVDSSSELPLLKSFCSELREKELHSLSFDVLTTIHRRQKEKHHPERKHSGSDAPLFRAGACYRPVRESTTPELQKSTLSSGAPISRDCLFASSHFDQRTPKQSGLFGLQKKISTSFRRVNGSVLSTEASPAQSVFTADQLTENVPLGSSVSVQAVPDLQQDLDPKLEAQFPTLGRLLEWMARWADRRAPFGLHDRKKKEKGGTPGEGVMIRVRASAPAVLTSLSLLELKYNTVLGTDRYTACIQVPEVQLTVSPVLQPGAEKKLEKESSVDTGYPGSAHTAPDQDFQQENISDGNPHTDDPEELPTFQTNPPSAVQAPASSPQLTFDDLNLTPEKEDKGCDSEGLGLPSSSPIEDVTSNSFSPDTSLKLADIDLSGKAEEIPSPSFSSGHPEPQPSNQPQTLPDSDSLRHSDTVIGPQELQPPTLTAEEPTVDSATLNQMSTPSPMRQLLGQDLFRLVQHINYLSLREVIGASFSNLEVAQQPSSVTQPDMTCLLPDVASATRFISDRDALPNHSGVSAAVQTPGSKPGFKFNDAGCQFAPQMPKTSPASNQHQSNINPQSNVCIRDAEYQEMQPLSVQAESPDVQQMQNRKRIPSSQGLLATSDTTHTVQSRPSPLTSHCGTQNDSAPPVLGLRLLKFSSPLLSQHNPPAPQPHTRPTANQEIPRSFQVKSKLDFNKGRDDRIKFSSPVTRPYNSTPRTSHPQIWPSGQSASSPQLPPAFSAPSPFQGLRLLQLQPHPHHNITFPKLPTPSFSRPSAVIPVPVKETSSIKLLQINFGPKVMLPPPVPSTHVTCLNSREELQNSEIVQQEVEKTPLQLLRVQQAPEKPTTSPSCATNRRHKRREEKAKGGKSEVNFRPNESIIPTQETPAMPTSGEPVVVENIPSDQHIPEPSVESFTGQSLLGKIFSTSAELHAMASTSKRPPECYDAFTNTDFDCPPKCVDKAVSVQASEMTGSPKSASSANFQISHDDSVQDGVQEPWQPEKNTSPPGHQFLSVLDLKGEDGSLHPDPQMQDVPSVRPSSPTSSQLHVLATSVLRNNFFADPPLSVQIPEDCGPLPTPQEIPVESPSESKREYRSVSERVTSLNCGSEICRAIKDQSATHQSVSSSLLSVGFSSRLSVLDTQLAALQNIADHLETDLVKSRMVVNSLEKLSSPSVKSTKAAKKTVRLSLPLQAWPKRPDPDLSAEINASELEENTTQQVDKDLLLRDEAGPSSFHPPPDHFTDPDEIPHECVDADPGQSELLDTVELLDELLEEGYLSLTDLDLFESQAVQHNSGQDLEQSDCMSEGRAFSLDDRSELRVWMRRKHRERLAAYKKHRTSLREQEHKPYNASPSRTQAASWKTRENKEKLLKQYNQRMQEAWSLAGEFNLPPRSQASNSRGEGSRVLSKKWSTAAPLSRPHSESVSDKSAPKYLSGEALPHPQTRSVERRPSEGLHRRLGLHRPVTLLPGDRLSQVTRRGMLSKTLPKRDAAGQSDTRHNGYQRGAGLNQTYSKGGAAETRPKVEGRKEANSSEPHRPQRLQQFELVVTELVGEEENDASGVSGIEWLNSLSESADSCLSKIDWAAIERMAAAEEANDD